VRHWQVLIHQGVTVASNMRKCTQFPEHQCDLSAIVALTFVNQTWNALPHGRVSRLPRDLTLLDYLT
jgi:hypothetical protein